MTSTRPDLAALIGSRICHDLISPIGAISNGVELMEMTQTDMGPEFELISESVANANARVRLFRIAFGAADPGIEIASAEIVSGRERRQCFSTWKSSLVCRRRRTARRSERGNSRCSPPARSRHDPPKSNR